MVISLDKIIRKYDLKITGVIHIGAHYGQEYKDYAKHNIQNLIFFEPLASNYHKLLSSLPKDKGIITFNLALGNTRGLMEMYVETANSGMSCSLLEPALHLTQYPHIKFPRKETVKVNKLDNIPFDRTAYNMINIDVQGYELEVFKGADRTLDFIDIIYTEVNREEVYKNCAKIEEIDSFLSEWDFDRMETDWAGGTWGDALYLKQ
jgi:FkbM family methyltransferase